LAERAQNNQGAFFEGLQRAIDTAKGDPLSAVIDHLYTSNSEYKGRSKEQQWPTVLPNGAFPPAIYAIPRK
jgi:hypothetical protein